MVDNDDDDDGDDDDNNSDNDDCHHGDGNGGDFDAYDETRELIFPEKHFLFQKENHVHTFILVAQQIIFCSVLCWN